MCLLALCFTLAAMPACAGIRSASFITSLVTDPVAAKEGDTVIISFRSHGYAPTGATVNDNACDNFTYDQQTGCGSCTYDVTSLDSDGWATVGIETQGGTWEFSQALLIDNAAPVVTDVAATPYYTCDPIVEFTAADPSPSPPAALGHCEIAIEDGEYFTFGYASPRNCTLDESFDGGCSGYSENVAYSQAGCDGECATLLDSGYIEYPACYLPETGTVGFWLSSANAYGLLLDTTNEQAYSGPSIALDSDPSANAHAFLWFDMWDAENQEDSDPLMTPLHREGWDYVAISYGGSGAYLYLNGELVDSLPNCTTEYTDTSGSFYIGPLYAPEGLAARLDCLRATSVENDANITSPPTSFGGILKNGGGCGDGDHVVHVRAVDLAGNCSAWDLENDVHILVDLTAPAIAVTSPATGELHIAGGPDSFVLRGTVTDPLSGLASMKIDTGSGEDDITNITNGTWIYEYSWSSVPEQHTIYITATDNAGNESTKPVRVYVNPGGAPSVIYVDGDSEDADDENDGDSWEYPKKTVQGAIRRCILRPRNMGRGQ